jgi:hypothetical protein
MLQAFEWVRRREERERGKGEKKSDALREGAISTHSKIRSAMTASMTTHKRE